MFDLDAHFPRYTDYPSQVPVWRVSHEVPNVIHRFFDTSPISPSGRYAAVFQLPEKDHEPQPGELCGIYLIDLATGETKKIWETAGWEYQMGANINWGASDHELIFNDVDTTTWMPYAVVLDPLSGESRKLGGTIYHASPDGKYIVSANMKTMRRTQGGYGVVVPDDHVPYNVGSTEEDGIWLTEVATGRSRLLISIKDAAEQTFTAERLAEYTKSEVYGFHSKFSPDGSRLMFSLRYFPDYKGKVFNAMEYNWDGLRYDVFTIRPDGSDLHLAVGAEQWEKNGHHTTWKPDNRTLTMNLDIYRKGMRFCQCNYDGAGLAPIGEYTGSGHPSFHKNLRWVVTDSYAHEPVAFPDTSVPIRLLDMSDMSESLLSRVKVTTRSFYRLDPHPVWCCNYNLLCFNGLCNGTRSLMIADVSSLQ